MRLDSASPVDWDRDARMALTISELRSGAALAIEHAGPTSGTITTSRGIARVLENPRLPDIHPEAVWTTPVGAKLFGPTGLPVTAEADKGAMGDCYAIAAFGSMTMREANARQLGGLFEETAQHYVVHLPGDSVAVTKDLPFLDGHPAFASQGWRPGSTQGIWSGVLEKALAAREPEGYQSLVGGQARYVYDILGGTTSLPRPSGSTPIDDVRAALAQGLPVSVGIQPYESVARPGLPVIRMSVGQENILKATGLVGNHYYAVDRIEPRSYGMRKGLDTVVLRNPVNGTQPKEGLLADEFNAVVTDTDSPLGYGDYMRTGIGREALLSPAFKPPETAEARAAAAARDTFGTGA
ncbi:MAG: Calpain family cysteine protease [Thermoleophilia bacterium]|nr:Calpain family cysteine protease [Thermoleophilia bacterium]